MRADNKGARDTRDIGSATVIKSYAGALSGDKNLKTEGAGSAAGKCCRAIRVGTAGNLKIDTAEDVTDTIPNVAAGETIGVQAKKIYQTGTTAQDITVFW